MIKNYFKIAWRNIYKHKTYSIINILGLSLGIAVCLLILHYVNFEKSYDNFHTNNENIYRLRYERYSENGEAVRFASSTPPAAPLLRGKYPEFEKIGRIIRYKSIVNYEEKKFYEERLYFAESEVLDILKFEFIEGDPLTGISDPNNAFVSESIAKKYFGNDYPIGKTFSVDKKIEYKVVGIFKDIPSNSHLKFDILLSYKNVKDIYGDDFDEAWGHSGAFTYLKVAAGTNINLLQSKIAKAVDDLLGEDLRKYKMEILLPLQPILDIHLNSKYMQEYEVGGDIDSVNFLSIIAIFILIMAWVNYINLSTARSLTRAKEIGIRKVAGAARSQLITQLFFETLVINFISILVALAIIKVSYPLFDIVTGIPSGFNIFNQVWIWIVLASIFAIGVILSGIYPVIAISSFNPLSVLKGKFSNSRKGINLRRGLVVFQFTIAIILIAGTFLMYKQISFMREGDLGVDISQTIAIKAPRIRTESFASTSETFKEIIKNNSKVSDVCLGTELPGRQIYWDAGGIYKAGENIEQAKNYQILGVDENYIDMFSINLLYGRNFSDSSKTDSSSLILNETAVKWMGFENPESAVGEKVIYWGETFVVVGVVSDYHHQSFKEKFVPHIFRYLPTGRGVRGIYAVKLNVADVKNTIEYIEENYAQLFPGNPFEFYFLDEYYDQQYKADELFGKVAGLFALLAIFITGLGIFGLAAFSAAQRKKEIGIRKVLGASLSKIILMMNKDIIMLVSFSFLLAAPIIYYLIESWLQNFATKLGIDLFTIVFSGIIILIFAILTVSSQSLKAALTNPVDSIRDE